MITEEEFKGLQQGDAFLYDGRLECEVFSVSKNSVFVLTRETKKRKRTGRMELSMQDVCQKGEITEPMLASNLQSRYRNGTMLNYVKFGGR